METVTAGGRKLTKRWWRTGMHGVDIEPHDIAYFHRALERVADEFGIPKPEIEDPDSDGRSGWTCDFLIEGVEAGAYLNGRKCSIAVASEEKLERIVAALVRLAA